MRRTSHRTHPDTSVNRPYLTLTEADSDALWSSVTTGPRRFISQGGLISQRKAKKTADVRLFFKSLKPTWAVGGSLSTSLAIELKPFRF